MYRIHLFCALLLTILLSAVPVGAQNFSECGVLAHGVEAGCVIFVSDSHIEYLVIGDVLPFVVGDRVAIVGTVDPFLPTTCQQGLPLIIDTVLLCDDCCGGRVGDANGLGGDEPTIGDVSVMIDAKFITGTCDGVIDCIPEADINGSGGNDPTCDDITIGDIALLIDCMFISGDPIPCSRQCPGGL